MPEYELSSWMSRIKDDVPLSQVVLPATHDSGMHYQSWGSAYNLINPIAWLAKGSTALAATIDDAKSGRSVSGSHDNFVTQLVPIAGQLACGARQFDLRMTENWGEYKAFHGHVALSFVGMRRYGESWKSVCAGIAAFMKTRVNSDVLVLKMDKQDKKEKKLAQMLSDALWEANVPYNHLWERPKLKCKYVDQEKMGNLRGRVLLCAKKSFLDACKGIQRLHPAIELCIWAKNEAGKAPNDANPNALLGKDEYPTYLLLGSSDAKGAVDDKKSPLVKQQEMKRIFSGERRTVGMRGIWFNTYSYLRDIKTFAGEIWSEGKARDRDALWLDGAARQNVASVDFLDEEKGRYIVDKNPASSWK